MFIQSAGGASSWIRPFRLKYGFPMYLLERATIGCFHFPIHPQRSCSAMMVQASSTKKCGCPTGTYSSNAFQSFSGIAGVTMSPVIFPFDLKEPNHDFFFSGGGGGSMIAMGLPCRVTMTDRPVFLTLSSTARQVALNFEMFINSICSALPTPLY